MLHVSIFVEIQGYPKIICGTQHDDVHETVPYMYTNMFDTFWPLCTIFVIIIWLCLTRTGNYQMHEFDWLKWILTAV